MLTRPWMILSAPRFAWYLPDDPATWPDLQHLNTGFSDRPLTEGSEVLTAGHTLWSAQVQLERTYNAVLHVAWEWVEVKRGVVCLVDPNAILTNIDFLSADGYVLPPLTATTCATRLVTATPWQERLAEALRESREERIGSHAEIQRAPRAVARLERRLSSTMR